VPLLAEMLPELECVGRVVEAAIAARKVIQKPSELPAAADGHVAAVKALAFSEHVFDEDKGPKPVARIAVVDLEDPVPRPLAVLETSWTRVIRQRPTGRWHRGASLAESALEECLHAFEFTGKPQRMLELNAWTSVESARGEAVRPPSGASAAARQDAPERAVQRFLEGNAVLTREWPVGWRRDRDQASRSSGSQAS
jgi:hypothetical protein